MSHLVRIASSMLSTASKALEPRGPAPISNASESFLATGVAGVSDTMTASPFASSRPSGGEERGFWEETKGVRAG